jgi:hypothetical protein
MFFYKSLEINGQIQLYECISITEVLTIVSACIFLLNEIIYQSTHSTHNFHLIQSCLSTHISFNMTNMTVHVWT